MYKTTILLITFVISLSLYGHDGHEHAPALNTNEKHKYFSSEASSAKFEVLVTYNEIQPAVLSEFTLFLSDFNTNLPLDSAELVITSPDDHNLVFNILRERSGIYKVSAEFPEAKIYRLHVAIKHRDEADLIALPGIDASQHRLEETSSESSGAIGYVLLFAGGLLIGIILMSVYFKMSGQARAHILLTIILLDIAGNTHTAFAHGGESHNHAEVNSSDVIYIPKETQFLFGITTHKTMPDNFSPQTELQGRIIPASSGQSVVRSAQDGTVLSVGVSVGQSVTKGQLLAVIDPAIDAGSMVNFAAERNLVHAEYEAARKEYDRVQLLKGIVSARETEEATSRFLAAESNKKLLDNLAMGTKDPSGLIYLRAPISGTLDYFRLTKDASVSAGESLFTITDLSTVYAEVTLYSDVQISTDSLSLFTVEAYSRDEQLYKAKFLSSSATINPGNQTRTILLEVENSNQDLKIGQFVLVHASEQTKTRTLTLPGSCISEINGKQSVFTKISAEQFAVRYITTGRHAQSVTEVTDGLVANERIASNGIYQLKTIYLTK